MKVLGICGSPRKGNTYFMLDTILNSAKKEGADTELIVLADKNIKHCGGDMSCDKRGNCHIDDDMKEIYEKLELADVIVVGSPSYFNNVSGIMKDLIDRCNPYWKNNKLKGKKVFAIGVGAEDGADGKGVIPNLETFCRGMHLDIIGTYYASGEQSGDVAKKKDVIKELVNIGKRLVE